MIRCGEIWFSVVVWHGEMSFGMVVWHGQVWWDVVWCSGTAWAGVVRCGLVGLYIMVKRGEMWCCGTAWSDVVRYGLVWLYAWRDVVWTQWPKQECAVSSNIPVDIEYSGYISEGAGCVCMFFFLMVIDIFAKNIDYLALSNGTETGITLLQVICNIRHYSLHCDINCLL